MKKLNELLLFFAWFFGSFFCMVFHIQDYDFGEWIEHFSFSTDELISDPLEIRFCEMCYIPDYKIIYILEPKYKKRIEKLNLDVQVRVCKSFNLL